MKITIEIPDSEVTAFVERLAVAMHALSPGLDPNQPEKKLESVDPDPIPAEPPPPSEKREKAEENDPFITPEKIYAEALILMREGVINRKAIATQLNISTKYLKDCLIKFGIPEDIRQQKEAINHKVKCEKIAHAPVLPKFMQIYDLVLAGKTYDEISEEYQISNTLISQNILYAKKRIATGLYTRPPLPPMKRKTPKRSPKKRIPPPAESPPKVEYVKETEQPDPRPPRPPPKTVMLPETDSWLSKFEAQQVKNSNT